MTSSKKIGVWMDYSSALIIAFSERPQEIETIKSEFKSKLVKEKNNGLQHLYSLAKQCKTDYLEKIAATILNYDKVLLFGPTDAKVELFKMLSDDQRFIKIKTYLKETGNMTINERNKYIRKHFTNTLLE
jgi:hypothetical protein